MRFFFFFLVSVQAFYASDTRLYFSSQESLKDKFLENVRNEKVGIRIVTQRISDKEVVDAILEAHQRKILVQVIVDSIALTKNSPLYLLAEKGVEVFIWKDRREGAFKKRNAKRMKHNFCLFGADISWIGSYSFFIKGHGRHAEEALCLEDKKVSKIFFEEFESMKIRSCQPFSCYVKETSHSKEIMVSREKEP